MAITPASLFGIDRRIA